MVSLRDRCSIAGSLDGIVIERRNFVRVHAVRRKPVRDVMVAQAFDVGEYLAGAGARGGAGGRKSIADKNQAGLQVAAALVQIRRPYLDLSGDFEFTRDPAQ